MLDFLRTAVSRRIALCLPLLFLAGASGAQPSEVTVAAASDLTFAIKEIIAGFERATGNRVKLILGSSGNFYAQILNGAPFQVFLSADAAYPRQLEAAGRTEPGSAYVYGLGKIVLWAPNSSGLEVRRLQFRSLLDPRVRRIAIANPQHAPYGRAAVAALEGAGVYAKVKAKLVLGENISQAAQFVQSGAAQAGIIALSLALSESLQSSGVYWEIPPGLYPAMEQSAVLLKPATPAARAFHEWLRRPESRAILLGYGFTQP